MLCPPTKITCASFCFLLSPCPHHKIFSSSVFIFPPGYIFCYARGDLMIGGHSFTITQSHYSFPIPLVSMFVNFCQVQLISFELVWPGCSVVARSRSRCVIFWTWFLHLVRLKLLFQVGLIFDLFSLTHSGLKFF